METALHDIEMGAYMMVVGKSDILKTIREGGDTLHRIADAVPGEKLIFEAGPGDWPEIARWLLTEFGPETNIENVGPDQIITLEAMRHGLNCAVEYHFFEPYANLPIPEVGQQRNGPEGKRRIPPGEARLDFLDDDRRPARSGRGNDGGQRPAMGGPSVSAPLSKKELTHERKFRQNQRS